MIQVSLCHRLGASYRWLRPVINALGYAQKYCTSCGLAGNLNDVENYVHCQSYGCKGTERFAVHDFPLNNQLRKKYMESTFYMYVELFESVTFGSLDKKNSDWIFRGVINPVKAEI